MTLKPEFLLLSEKDPRPFTNREAEINLFKRVIKEEIFEKPRIINFFGIGGIGKTSLKNELIKATSEMESYVVTEIDFNAHELRQPSRGILHLRFTLGKKYKVKFPLFDIAFSEFWIRTNPHLKISSNDIPFLEEGSIVMEIVSLVSEVPGLGLIPKIPQVVRKLGKKTQDWLTLKKQEELRELQTVNTHNIPNYFPYFFSEDLKGWLKENNKSIVFFLDSYDEINKDRDSEATRFSYDSWVRSLVIRLNQGCFCIFGQQKIFWHEYKSEWKDYISYHQLEEFSETNSKSYLSACGINKANDILKILESTKGHPFFLSLMVDTYKRESSELELIGNRGKVVNRFMRYLPQDEIDFAKILSVARYWNREIFQLLAREFGFGQFATRYQQISNSPFIQMVDEDMLILHSLMREELINRIEKNLKTKIEHSLFGYFDKILKEKKELNTSSKNIQRAYIEAFYFGKELLNLKELLEWNEKNEKVFIENNQLELCINQRKELLSFLKEKYPGKKKEIASCLHNLASMLLKKGEYNEAKPLYNDSFELKRKIFGENSIEAAIIQNELAIINIELGFYYKADKQFREIIQLYRKKIQDCDGNLNRIKRELGTSLSNHGDLLRRIGQFEEANLVLVEAKSIYQELFNENNPVYGGILNNLAVSLEKIGNFSDAEKYYHKALNCYKQIHSPSHFSIATIRGNLGILLLKSGKYDEAETELSMALSIKKKWFDQNHPEVIKSIESLAELKFRVGKEDEGYKFFEMAIVSKERFFGSNHINIGLSYRYFGNIIKDISLTRKVAFMLEKAIDVFSKLPNPVSKTPIIETFIELAEFQLSQKATVEALQSLNEAKNWFEREGSLFTERAAELWTKLGKNYIMIEDYEDAVFCLERAIVILTGIYGPTHTSTIVLINQLKEIQN